MFMMIKVSMQEVAISVIVPFYNAESTIERLLTSLKDQTLSSFEVVMVNDGSTDRTVEVVKDFMALNPDFALRIRVVSYNFRRGVVEARRLGLKEAAGRFIAHCDADDYVDPPWLDDMYNGVISEGADLAVAPYISETPRTKTNPEHHRKTLLKTIHHDHIPQGLNEMTINTANFSLWNKLISREFIERHSLSYLPGVERWEDLGLLTQIYACQPKIAIIPTPSYHYIDDPNSKTLSKSKKEFLLRDHLMIALLVEQWLEERKMTDKYTPYLNYLKFISKIKHLRGQGKNVRQWLETFPEVNNKILGMKRVPLLVRLMTAAVANLPSNLTQKVANLCDIFYH